MVGKILAPEVAVNPNPRRNDVLIAVQQIRYANAQYLAALAARSNVATFRWQLM